MPEEYGGSGASYAHDRAGARGARVRLPEQRAALLAQRADVGLSGADRAVRQRGPRSAATFPVSARASSSARTRCRSRSPAPMRLRLAATAERTVRAATDSPVRRRSSPTARSQTSSSSSRARGRSPASPACRRSSSIGTRPGLVVGRPLAKMGLDRVTDVRSLPRRLRDLGSDRLLGREGAGMAVFTTAMRLERSCILACVVGAMQHQLETCLDYACSRRQFGQAIGAFQAVSHRLVEMRLRVETARLMLYRAGAAARRGRPCGGRVGPDEAAHQRGIRRLEPRRRSDSRRVRLPHRVRARARATGRRRQPALLGHLRACNATSQPAQWDSAGERRLLLDERTANDQRQNP